jgi:hypothetical protein
MTDNVNVSPILLAAVANLDTGQLYELARGLMLSDLDKQKLLDLLFAELDERSKSARDSETPLPAWTQE